MLGVVTRVNLLSMVVCECFLGALLSSLGSYIRSLQRNGAGRRIYAIKGGFFKLVHTTGAR